MIGPAPGLDLTPAHLALVRAILEKHLPDREVRAFGSRVQGRARPYSDLDLVILGEQPLPLSRRSALEEDFSKSDLPFKVDLVEWAATSPEFRKLIETHWEPIRAGAGPGGPGS